MVRPVKDTGAGPGVVDRTAVRIRDASVVTRGRGAQPYVLDISCVAARRRVEVGLDQHAFEQDALPARCGDRVVARRGFMHGRIHTVAARVPVIDLAACSAVLHACRIRVAARHDGLGLEGLDRPRRRALSRNDAIEVVVLTQVVDDPALAAARSQHQRAAISNARVVEGPRDALNLSQLRRRTALRSDRECAGERTGSRPFRPCP